MDVSCFDTPSRGESLILIINSSGRSEACVFEAVRRPTRYSPIHTYLLDAVISFVRLFNFIMEFTSIREGNDKGLVISHHASQVRECTLKITYLRILLWSR